MLDHVSIQCADVAASAAFYDAVLAPLGGSPVMDFGTVIGYGVPPMPDFWIGQQQTGDGFRESHIAFTAVGLSGCGASYSGHLEGLAHHWLRLERHDGRAGEVAADAVDPLDAAALEGVVVGL